MSVSRDFYSLFRKNPDFFGHIEGLRAFTAVRVMLQHIALFASFFFTPSEYLEMLKHPLFKWTISTFMLINTFFVISSFVIGYSLIKEYKERGKVDIVNFIIRRCARVYPLYLAVLVFSIPFLYDCSHNIWTNILQINNFLPLNEQFMGWTWSLAVDFQFYLLFSIFMWLLSKNIIGKTTCISLSVGLVLLPFFLTPILMTLFQYTHYRTEAFIINSQESIISFSMGVDKLHVHTSAIFYGIITAYIVVYHQKKLENFLKRLPKMTINFISLTLFGLIIFLLINDPIMYVGNNQDVWQTSVYWAIAVQRTLYSVILCLLLLLAHAPKGIVIRIFVNILGSSLLRPFGRITYATYLIHPLVIIGGYFIFFATHSSITAEAYFLEGLKLIFITYLIALPVYLFIEQPGMYKMRTILQKFRQRRSTFTFAADTEKGEQSAHLLADKQ